jgi:hypothetical protein
MQLGALFCASHEGIQRSFSCRFAAPCSMKIASPPLDKEGLQGGFEHGDQATPAQRATPPKEGFFRRDTELTAEFEV